MNPMNIISIGLIIGSIPFSLIVKYDYRGIFLLSCWTASLIVQIVKIQFAEDVKT